jgi:capsular polysaccharide biosynthesis protein
VARLELLTPLGRWGSLRSDVQRTFDRIAGRNRSVGCRERLCLTREGVGNRRLANEGEVRRLLENHRFIVVYTEQLSFRAQVEMFSMAEMICGPLGSAFTNLVFAPPDCRLVALIPELWEDVFYYDLAAIRGMPWLEVRGPAVNAAHRRYIRNDFQVNIDRLASALELAESLG